MAKGWWGGRKGWWGAGGGGSSGDRVQGELYPHLVFKLTDTREGWWGGREGLWGQSPRRVISPPCPQAHRHQVRGVRGPGGTKWVD